MGTCGPPGNVFFVVVVVDVEVFVFNRASILSFIVFDSGLGLFVLNRIIRI